MFYLIRGRSRPNGSDIVMMKPAAGVAFLPGDALVFANGVVAKAAATAKPTHVSAGLHAAASTEKVATYPVREGMEFMTTFAADASSVAEGSRVTLHTDSAQVTATTASGVARIERKLGTGKAGTKVVVTFNP